MVVCGISVHSLMKRDLLQDFSAVVSLLFAVFVAHNLWHCKYRVKSKNIGMNIWQVVKGPCPKS
jgi:hypothetical protein